MVLSPPASCIVCLTTATMYIYRNKTVNARNVLWEGEKENQPLKITKFLIQPRNKNVTPFGYSKDIKRGQSPILAASMR